MASEWHGYEDACGMFGVGLFCAAQSSGILGVPSMAMAMAMATKTRGRFVLRQPLRRALGSLACVSE